MFWFMAQRVLVFGKKENVLTAEAEGKAEGGGIAGDI
jgi:hypothetical protein